MAGWKSGRNQHNVRRLCPNCGLDMWLECECFQEYVGRQFPFRAVGEDAYADAKPYTPEITDKRERK